MAQTMTTSPMTEKQIERAVEIFRAQLRKHREELPSDAVQQVFGESELGPEWLAVLRNRVEAKILFVPQGTTTITLAEDHDPDQDFRTRSGLWVSNDFRSRIVANARKSPKGVNIKVNFAKLTQDATDEKIEAGLPVEHLFDETTMCAVIDGLIAKQKNGEEGTLLNNGYANLFYAGSCVVRVRWSSSDREWRVFTWVRVDFRWLAGLQVFSPAN